MGISWRLRRDRKHEEPGDRPPFAPLATEPQAAPADDEPDFVIDLRGDVLWSERVTGSRSAALYEELRARRAREEAMRDLKRLRNRHWSPDRIIEEGRLDIDFWEHHEADPYAVLSLMPGASLEDAAAARRRIAQQCHPDRLGEDADAEEAMRRMIAANAAYDRLRRALRTV